MVTDWTINDLTDRAKLTEFLVQQRLSREAVSSKIALFSRCAAALTQAGLPLYTLVDACFVPGRIEVFGKHTDYAGGRSIVAAVERGFCVVMAPRADRTVRVIDAARDESAEFPLAVDLVPRTGHWSNYPMTAARRIARNFPGDLRGADVAFASDLPAAAGLSSSSALIVSSFLALSAANDLTAHERFLRHIRGREDLAGYLGTIENGQSFGELAGDKGVGTFGGSEDHTAILCTRPGCAVQYSYCPVRFERGIRVPDDYCFVVAVSGVVAEKTGAAQDRYNRVARLASAALEVWRNSTGRDDPHLAAALASSPDGLDRFREALNSSRHAEFEPRELIDRVEQFYEESEQLIPAVADDLTGGAVDQFGGLADRSQALGARCLGNQVPETIFLAGTARELGAAAASAFGAGFGGSVWALVRLDHARKLKHEWSQRYAEAFPLRAAGATFFTTCPGPGAILFSGSLPF